MFDNLSYPLREPSSSGTCGSDIEAGVRKTTINVGIDFTRFPGGRYREDGAFSGEQFREDVLIPALQDNGMLTVFLDGAEGYPSSFLEEAFGGLVRAGFDRRDLRARLKVIARDPHLETYRVLAERYMDDAGRASPRH